ncbi:MAG: hypothetical protein RL199_1611 [Pseudomonadota bacterium]|jgi:hypothetical protein
MKPLRRVPTDIALLDPLQAALRALEGSIDDAEPYRFHDFAAWRQTIALRVCIAKLRDQLRRYRRTITRPEPPTGRRPHPPIDDYPF